jgi:hypothetical protein
MLAVGSRQMGKVVELNDDQLDILKNALLVALEQCDNDDDAEDVEAVGLVFGFNLAEPE